jgi:peptide chain release factor 3
MLESSISPYVLEVFRLNAELAAGGYANLDRASYREGHLTPVLFGSALRDFAVPQLLDLIGGMAPPPQAQPTATGRISPSDPAVSGFVFKVQANMDPQHRDRIAFVRLCSGRFRRGMRLSNTRSGRSIAVQSPIFFFARDREVIDEAFPGDVIGVPNHGTLRVGDTLAESDAIRFTGLPAFAPEVLRRVRLGDTMRVKQLRRALADLAEEGLVQIFRPSIGSNWIVGAVGALQLDVLVSRAREEYGVDISFESVPFTRARWPCSTDERLLQTFMQENPLSIVADRDGSPVFLARSDWEMHHVSKRYPGISFQETRELF